MGERIEVEPLRKGPGKCLGPVNRQPGSLGLDEAHIAAPPGDEGGQRSTHAHRLGKAWVPMTERSFGLLEQHEALVVATNFEPHYQRILGQRREIHPPLHVDQQRLQIEVLTRRFTREPTLSPCAEGAHKTRELLPRFGECVF